MTENTDVWGYNPGNNCLIDGNGLVVADNVSWQDATRILAAINPHVTVQRTTLITLLNFAEAFTDGGSGVPEVFGEPDDQREVEDAIRDVRVLLDVDDDPPYRGADADAALDRVTAMIAGAIEDAPCTDRPTPEPFGGTVAYAAPNSWILGETEGLTGATVVHVDGAWAVLQYAEDGFRPRGSCGAYMIGYAPPDAKEEGRTWCYGDSADGGLFDTLDGAIGELQREKAKSDRLAR